MGAHLAKDNLIDVQGMVTAVHSGGLYRVQCDPGHEVLAQLCGRMRRFKIKVVPGDRVTAYHRTIRHAGSSPSARGRESQYNPPYGVAAAGVRRYRRRR